MKRFARFLLAALCAVPFCAGAANVPSTRGNNLTAYNGASGATNNNNWNALMNVRSGADSADLPVADFGNCNAIVLRCAQPKCANGGCTDASVAATIVAGCVRSNDVCAQYGDELVQYISAQLVAQSTAKANAANAAAADAAAQQNAQQMQQMQMQMQQMQSQMAAQNAETVAQLQSALEEQKQLTAQAIADATAARATTPDVTTSYTANENATAAQTAAAGALTTAQQIAAQNGVSADILAREQITGQIMSSIENAETQLKTLKTAMTDAFEYAGCNSKGGDCTGPKRVKMFKQKAMDFFEPYENVLDELYDALITAQAVGVDITDIYMMLNDSCNVWGKYMCEENQDLRYTKRNCIEGVSIRIGAVIGGANCTIGKIIPSSDGGCQPLGLIPNGEEVRYNWLNPDTGDDTNIKVGCMADMLETSALFRNRKKGADIDIETLKRIIEQDAPSIYGANLLGGAATTPKKDGVKFCAVGYESYADLQKIVSLNKLPDTVCVSNDGLTTSLQNQMPLPVTTTTSYSNNNAVKTTAQINCENAGGTWGYVSCLCPTGQRWYNDTCVINGTTTPVTGISGLDTSVFSGGGNNAINCTKLGGKWNYETNYCNCVGSSSFTLCMQLNAM